MGRFNNPAALNNPRTQTPPPSPPVSPAAVFGAAPRRAPLPAAYAQPVTTVRRLVNSIKGVPSPETLEASWNADAHSSIRQLGFLFALAFVFTRFSMIHEVMTFGLGLKPYAIVLLGPPALLLAILSGGLQRCTRTRAGMLVMGFMVWLIVIIPLSSWRGGSFQTVQLAFKTELVMFFMIAGLAVTIGDIRRMGYAIAAGGALDVIIGKIYGTDWNGRFTLAFGSVSNPNDYATHLLLTMPFLLMYAVTGRRTLLRVAAALCTVVGIVWIVRTGSRGALIALAVSALFALLKATNTQRIALAGALAVILVIGFAVLPSTVRARYTTMFSDDTPDTTEALEEATIARGSSAARTQLLRASVTLTLMNPIFGVGPGQFSTSEDTLAREAGHSRGHWSVSHNTYTEISSETGIPGFLLFTGAMGCSFLLLNRIYQRTRRDPRLRPIANMAYCILVALTAFAICIFFASMGYKYYVPSIVGLVSAFAVAAQREIWAIENGLQPATS